MNLSSDIGLSPIAAQAGSIAVKLGRPSRRHYPGDTFPSYSPGSGASPNELVNRMRKSAYGRTKSDFASQFGL